MSDALFLLLVFGPGLVGLAYGMRALFTGRIQLGRNKWWIGAKGHLAGLLCIVISAAVLYWQFFMFVRLLP